MKRVALWRVFPWIAAEGPVIIQPTPARAAQPQRIPVSTPGPSLLVDVVNPQHAQVIPVTFYSRTHSTQPSKQPRVRRARKGTISS